jgi:hypothetical protein
MEALREQKKAIVAVARKFIVRIRHLVVTGEEYKIGVIE